MLEKEFKYFKDHQEELVKKHEGKYLVIVGEEVVGVYNAEIDAYTEAKNVTNQGLSSSSIACQERAPTPRPSILGSFSASIPLP